MSPNPPHPYVEDYCSDDDSERDASQPYDIHEEGDFICSPSAYKTSDHGSDSGYSSNHSHADGSERDEFRYSKSTYIKSADDTKDHRKPRPSSCFTHTQSSQSQIPGSAPRPIPPMHTGLHYQQCNIYTYPSSPPPHLQHSLPLMPPPHWTGYSSAHAQAYYRPPHYLRPLYLHPPPPPPLYYPIVYHRYSFPTTNYYRPTPAMFYANATPFAPPTTYERGTEQRYDHRSDYQPRHEHEHAVYDTPTPAAAAGHHREQRKGHEAEVPHHSSTSFRVASLEKDDEECERSIESASTTAGKPRPNTWPGAHLTPYPRPHSQSQSYSTKSRTDYPDS